MKTLRFILLCSLLCLAVSPTQAAELNAAASLADTQPASNIPAPATRFDPVIEDLPLMNGLAPVPDQATLFVVPKSGRIADSVAKGAVDIDEVYTFYRRALPHLGWSRIDGRTYRRAGEQLRIDAHADGKVTTVRFSVKPD